jgi:hypothetical protein
VCVSAVPELFIEVAVDHRRPHGGTQSIRDESIVVLGSATHDRPGREVPREHRIAHAKAEKCVLEGDRFAHVEHLSLPGNAHGSNVAVATETAGVRQFESHVISEEVDGPLQVSPLVVKI